MRLSEVTYEVKLLSSKEIRKSMEIAMNTLCSENSCFCNLSVTTKWFWIYDKYTIKVTGGLDNIKKIEKQIKQLSLFHL